MNKFWKVSFFLLVAIAVLFFIIFLCTGNPVFLIVYLITFCATGITFIGTIVTD